MASYGGNGIVTQRFETAPLPVNGMDRRGLLRPVPRFSEKNLFLHGGLEEDPGEEERGRQDEGQREVEIDVHGHAGLAGRVRNEGEGEVAQRPNGGDRAEIQLVDLLDGKRNACKEDDHDAGEQFLPLEAGVPSGGHGHIDQPYDRYGQADKGHQVANEVGIDLSALQQIQEILRGEQHGRHRDDEAVGKLQCGVANEIGVKGGNGLDKRHVIHGDQADRAQEQKYAEGGDQRGVDQTLFIHG